MITYFTPFVWPVPTSPYILCGRKATLNSAEPFVRAERLCGKWGGRPGLPRSVLQLSCYRSVTMSWFHHTRLRTDRDCLKFLTSNNMFRRLVTESTLTGRWRSIWFKHLVRLRAPLIVLLLLLLFFCFFRLKTFLPTDLTPVSLSWWDWRKEELKGKIFLSLCYYRLENMVAAQHRLWTLFLGWVWASTKPHHHHHHHHQQQQQ